MTRNERQLSARNRDILIYDSHQVFQKSAASQFLHQNTTQRMVREKFLSSNVTSWHLKVVNKSGDGDSDTFEPWGGDVLAQCVTVYTQQVPRVNRTEFPNSQSMKQKINVWPHCLMCLASTWRQWARRGECFASLRVVETCARRVCRRVDSLGNVSPATYSTCTRFWWQRGHNRFILQEPCVTFTATNKPASICNGFLNNNNIKKDWKRTPQAGIRCTPEVTRVARQTRFVKNIFKTKTNGRVPLFQSWYLLVFIFIHISIAEVTDSYMYT